MVKCYSWQSVFGISTCRWSVFNYETDVHLDLFFVGEFLLP